MIKISKHTEAKLIVESEETRRKMSETKKKYWKERKPTVNVPIEMYTEERIAEFFEDEVELAEIEQINKSRSCNDKNFKTQRSKVDRGVRRLWYSS